MGIIEHNFDEHSILELISDGNVVDAMDGEVAET
jgi:hypothetical protein